MYYSLFKRRNGWDRYKWLDLKLFFENILQPHHQILKIKYFTARVSGRNDPTQPIRQQTYLRALKTHIPELEVTYGKFLTHQKSMPLVTPVAGQTYVRVYKTEEKGSDVNLAVNLLNDGWKNEYDCAIVFSNDGDLSSPIRVAKNELGKIMGWVVPQGVHLSSELKNHFNFIQRVQEVHLSSSQLPTQIPNTNITKPRVW